MPRLLRYLLPPLAALLAAGCMKWDYGRTEAVALPEHGLFVVCEGNYKFGNATLAFYDPATGSVATEVFLRANGFKLGDTAQSMVVRDGVGWIVVNTSRIVFAVDPATMKERGRITGFTSPRYIHFVDDRKAYVTQIWDPRIAVVDPRRFEITGYIDCPGMTFETGSTERMVQYGDLLFVNCWSYQNRVLAIDTRTDRVVDAIETGIQPNSMALDAYGKLWVLCDGGYEGSPSGYEAPSLLRIDAATRAVERRFLLPEGAASELTLHGDELYWLDDAVWRMKVTDEAPPAAPLIESRRTHYYGLTVDPASGEIYLADAIDYQQAGIVYRYTRDGEPLDRFYTGITPGSFCWK
jgi:DNA-binding beta-propeller fold protein YncE